MFNTDIIVRIEYDVENPQKTIIRTNAKKEAVEEILATWLSDQIGKGKDESVFDEKDVYTVIIRLDMSDDTFFTTSDTNNKGLTCGIVMNVYELRGTIQICPLS